MSPRRTRAAVQAAAGLTALALSVTGCRLLPSRSAAPASVHQPAGRPALLMLAVDPATPDGMAGARALLADTARTGEHVILLDSRTGAVLDSSTAPAPPALTRPARPAALPSDPTDFERARYRQAMASYRVAVRADSAAWLRQERRQLAAWATAVTAAARRTRSLTAARQQAGITGVLSTAAADLSSLQQAGLVLGQRKVLVLLGPTGVTGTSVPALRAGLAGTTVVLTGFPGSLGDQAAWQAGLLGAGAARVVLLTPATASQLTAVVREGLDGALSQTLTDVLFASGKYQLQPAADGQLQALLYLLTVRYPRATVSINGYTDDVPAPGGNLLLSQERAQAVLAWLTSHHVAADRLEAVGYGDADPVAPNGPAGQPLNRRVVVIIDPAGR